MSASSQVSPAPINFPSRIVKWLKWFVAAVVLLFLLLTLVIVTGGYIFSGPHYRGSSTDHFNGEQFFNPGGALSGKSFKDFIRWRFNRKLGPWRDWVPAVPGESPPAKVDGGSIRATFINHATVLIQMHGVNILTDPIWSDRASPLSWFGPRRVRPPGIRFEDLPPIHAVVVSHNHYDHLDLPTLVRLRNKFDPVFMVQLGNAALLETRGFKNIVELDWWHSRALTPDVRIHSVPAQHFSSRGLFDRNKTLWGGYVIEGVAGKVFFAGDTGMGPHFDKIRKRFAPIRLALLPIGAFRPEWFMKEAHMSPAEAVDAHHRLGARTSMAIHFGTFHLGDDGETEPVDRWRAAINKNNMSHSRLWVLNFGEGRDVPGITNHK